MPTTSSTPLAATPPRPARRRRRPLRWAGRILLGLLALVVALAALGVAYEAVMAAADAQRFPPAGQFIDVGGRRLHLACQGAAGEGRPTVILESGLGGTSLDWGLVQPELAATTRVCAYDRAGYGWSDAGPEPRASEQIAGELRALLIAAGVPGPYVLVGHSAGGMHAQVYAGQHPEEVAGLVLIDPTPAQLMARFSAEERRALLPNPWLFGLLRVLQPVGALRLVRLPGAEALEPLPPAIRQPITAAALRRGVPAALAAEAAGIEASIAQTAAAAPLPADRPLIVVWHGRPAEPVALEPAARAAMEELVGRSANGRLVIAEGSGHYITFDRPDVVIDAVRRVVEAARTGRPLAH